MKGFVTIATGDERYYQMAANLLTSYRLFSKEPYPFAIIADKENQYTAQFDKVVILKEPKRSYMDKIELIIYAPYDETIFIDADCLAYGDLNAYWSWFEGCSDFSSFGLSRKLDYKGGFYDYEGTGTFKEKISYLTHLHGGTYFIRKGKACDEMLETCRYIIEHYDDFTFNMFNDAPADEPVFALAMSVHNMKSVEAPSGFLCFYPCCTYFQSDISKGMAEYSVPWLGKDTIIKDTYCVHWGNVNTSGAVYRLEEYRLNKMATQKRLNGIDIWRKRMMLNCAYNWSRVKRKFTGR